MLEACRESRHSGKMVEKLVEGIAVQVTLQMVEMVQMVERLQMVEMVQKVEMVEMVEMVVEGNAVQVSLCMRNEDTRLPENKECEIALTSQY